MKDHRRYQQKQLETIVCPANGILCRRPLGPAVHLLNNLPKKWNVSLRPGLVERMAVQTVTVTSQSARPPRPQPERRSVRLGHTTKRSFWYVSQSLSLPSAAALKHTAWIISDTIRFVDTVAAVTLIHAQVCNMLSSGVSRRPSSTRMSSAKWGVHNNANYAVYTHMRNFCVISSFCVIFA